MKKLLISAATLAALAAPAFAEGDAEKGEKEFRKCKSCHMIQDADGNDIVKGGKTGPNLYGIVGRVIGSQDGFRYSKQFEAAAEQGLTWDEAGLAAFVVDPSKHMEEITGESGRSKMSFKLKKGGEDVAAYLASVAE